MKIFVAGRWRSETHINITEQEGNRFGPIDTVISVAERTHRQDSAIR